MEVQQPHTMLSVAMFFLVSFNLTNILSQPAFLGESKNAIPVFRKTKIIYETFKYNPDSASVLRCAKFFIYVLK